MEMALASWTSTLEAGDSTPSLVCVTEIAFGAFIEASCFVF